MLMKCQGANKMKLIKKGKETTSTIVEIVRKKKLLSRYTILIISLFISACYFNLLQLPTEIVTGGTSGIAIIINAITGISPSLIIFVLSVVLLIIGAFLLGIEKTSGALISTIVYPIFVELTSHLGDYITFDLSDKILISIYIGIFEYGKYKRKPQDILRVENYCEPIIDEITWNATRNVLVKNKHSNYGEYIHLFSGLVKCPICGEIMSSSESFKYPSGNQKVYYHLRCKNHNCSGFGLHYNTEKIETKLKQVLEELTLFMLSMDNEIITCNSTKSDDVKDIEKAIEKLKIQEKRLVDLYLSSNLDVKTINHKNDVIKKEIDKLNQKKVRLDPDNNSKEYTIELVKKLDCTEKNNTLFFTNIKNIGFTFLYDLLSREAKRDMIHRLISMIEIKRDKNYNIEIKDIKFTDEFITKSSKEYLKYLNNIMNDNNIGIKFHKEIDEIELKNMESNYDILSIMKMKNKEYSNKFLEEFITKSQEHLYIDGIVSCPYIEKNVIKDILILVPRLVPKNELINTI